MHVRSGAAWVLALAYASQWHGSKSKLSGELDALPRVREKRESLVSYCKSGEEGWSVSQPNSN